MPKHDASRRQYSTTTRLLAAVQLMGPATALTAAADTVAGLLVAWELAPEELEAGLWLLPLAAGLLQAGGTVFNDVCDADRGRQRPGRPITLGLVSRHGAYMLSLFLFAAGIILASAYGSTTRLVAIAIAGLIAAYDIFAKHRPWLGPFGLGLCRSGTLLLGMAAGLGALAESWPLAVIPLAYVTAVTAIGREESEGRNPTGVAALGIFVLVAIAYGFLAVTRHQWSALIFVALFAAWSWPAFVHAAEAPSTDSIRGAVRTGMLNLVVCDAALAAAFAGPLGGLAVLLFLPMSRGLARLLPTP